MDTQILSIIVTLGTSLVYVGVYALIQKMGRKIDHEVYKLKLEIAEHRIEIQSMKERIINNENKQNDK